MARIGEEIERIVIEPVPSEEPVRIPDRPADPDRIKVPVPA